MSDAKVELPRKGRTVIQVSNTCIVEVEDREHMAIGDDLRANGQVDAPARLTRAQAGKLIAVLQAFAGTEEAPAPVARQGRAGAVDPLVERRADRHDETVERHPAYGMIGVSRVSCTPGKHLFGSDVRHSHYLSVRIQAAHMNRTLSRDWPHSDRQLIEVELSESQWAAFVSSPNMGDGVPCTLSWVEGRQVPDIGRVADKKEQFSSEVRRALADAQAAVEVLEARVKALGVSAKVREELWHQVLMVKNNLVPNVDFVGRQFTEHVERLTDAAKTEVGAYVQATVMRAGLQALGAPLSLDAAGQPAAEGDGAADGTKKAGARRQRRGDDE